MVAYVVIAQGWAVAIQSDLKIANRQVKDLKGMGYTAGLLRQKSQESAETLYCWWNYTKQKQAAHDAPPAVWSIRG